VSPFDAVWLAGRRGIQSKKNIVVQQLPKVDPKFPTHNNGEKEAI